MCHFDDNSGLVCEADVQRAAVASWFSDNFSSDSDLILPDDYIFTREEGVTADEGDAALVNFRNTPHRFSRVLKVVEPPAPVSSFLPAALARLKTYDRRKYRYKLARALSYANSKLGIKHHMNGCSMFAGYSKEQTEDGRQKRHKTVNIEARYNSETDSVYLHHTHLAHCKGVFVCPICGAMVRSTRFQEVYEISEDLINKGYKIFMLTLTARHDFNTELADFIEKFSGSWMDMNKKHALKDIKRFIQADHFIRSAEVTLDDIDSAWITCAEGNPSGWHFHYHVVFYYKCDDNLIDMFENGYNEVYVNKRGQIRNRWKKGIKQLWMDSLNKRGLSANYEISAYISRMNKELSNKENAEKAAKYICKNTAFEMTNVGSSKQGRKSGRMSISDLQERVAFGKTLSPHYKWYCGKWKEFVIAIHGIHFMDTSQGIRKETGIEIKSEDEILHGDNGDVILHEFYCNSLDGSSEYTSIAIQGNQGYLLNQLEKFFERKSLKDFVKNVSENKGKIEKQSIKSMFPHDEKVIIDDFIKSCIHMSQAGIDIEPSEFDENGKPIHAYFDPENVTCRSYYDNRIIDVMEGKVNRIPQSFSNISGVVLERLYERVKDLLPTYSYLDDPVPEPDIVFQ